MDANADLADEEKEGPEDGGMSLHPLVPLARPVGPRRGFVSDGAVNMRCSIWRSASGGRGRAKNEPCNPPISCVRVLCVRRLCLAGQFSVGEGLAYYVQRLDRQHGGRAEITGRIRATASNDARVPHRIHACALARSHGS